VNLPRARRLTAVGVFFSHSRGRPARIIFHRMQRSAGSALFPLALVALALGSVVGRAADDPRPFSETLTAADKQRLGLAAFTPVQLAELDAAIAAYSHGEKTAAVQQAVAQTERAVAEKVSSAEQQAAATAVEEYKKKQEPGVIARTLEIFQRKQEEAHRERFTARVVGEFRGWNGGTYFPLADGQVWRQVGTDHYELPPVPNAEIEIFKSSNGYWRLQYGDAWITVQRVQ
jgi:hypothetical protein